MFKKSILFCLASLLWLSGQTQCLVIPIPLEDRIESSELIVLGQVKEQQSFKLTGTNKLFTAHKINISALLKGSVSTSQLVLITEGGIIDGEAQIVNPSLELATDQEGLFMLNKHEFAGNPYNSLTSYQTYASLQGALLLKSGVYTDAMFDGTYSEEALLNLFSGKTGKVAKNLQGTLYQPRQTITSNSQRITAGITSLSPNPVIAGTIDSDQILSIKGSGFGTTRGTVEFANADDGGKTYIQSPIPATDIVSWTDTEIRIKVPRSAGTGNVRVNGGVTAPLQIKFSILEVNDAFYNFSQPTRQKISLVNRNQKGGYTFYYSDNFISNAAAVKAFENAIQNWRCATGMNYRIAGSLVSQTAASNDHVGLVSFDPTLPAGILGRATSYYLGKANSFCTQAQTVWYTDEIDMVFSANLPNGFNWNFGPTASVDKAKTYDFESVTLHELGHAHGLGHVIDDTKIMHYALNNGIDKRVLSPTDVEGGNYKIAQSQQTLCLQPDSVSGPIQKVAATQCNLPGELVLFQGSYDQAKGNMLNWRTAFEYETVNYTILKSTDGVHFDSLTTEPSLGDGVANRNYIIADTSNGDADNYYYQLKINRNDNRTRFSDIVKIPVPGDAEFIIYPTALVQQELTILPHKISVGTVTFKLYDALGKNVLTRELDYTKKGQKLQLDMPIMEWGLYFYQVTGGDTKSTGKIYINLK